MWPMIVYGINHKSAPIHIREQVALQETDIPGALLELMRAGVEECVILSTCNRTEFYCKTTYPQALNQWFSDLKDYVEILEGEAAVRHLMRVASGLDSMVLGEPQILGQMKRAFGIAVETGSVGKFLSRLFQSTFKAAKTARSRTSIGREPVSLAFAAIKMAQHIFKSLSTQTALLIGSGEMTHLAARHLKEQNIHKLIFANRTYEKAEYLAQCFGGEAIPLSAVPEQLYRADMLVTATASDLPIIGKGSVEAAMRARKQKPMVLIDLAMPRDIEPEIKSLDNIYLYDIDGLKSVVQANIQSREKAALQAESIIESETQAFFTWCASQKTVHLVKAYRKHHEQLRDEALAKAQKAIESGQPIEAVLAHLAHTLTNKLLHEPTIELKQSESETES